MSFIAEQAGGLGSDGQMRVMDIDPTEVRPPVSLPCFVLVPFLCHGHRLHEVCLFSPVFLLLLVQCLAHGGVTYAIDEEISI
jgi:hypothetical protein